MTSRGRWALCIAAALGSSSAPAAAQSLRFHLQGGGARAVSGDQTRETGLGWTAGGALELGLSRAVGIQLELSTLTLFAGDAPADPTLAPRGDANAQALMGGFRVYPFAASKSERVLSARGIWLDANAGAARTGDLTRAAFDAHLGFDLMWDKVSAGPYVGYVQVMQPDDTLRPDDAHIVTFGVHVGFGAGKPEPEKDRDGDGIIDRLDKCPDQPEDKDGFQDEDGCPDPDNDGDKVLDWEDACPVMAGKRTTDPKTNGCPVGDKDHDGVLDDVDQCPKEPEDKDKFQDDDGCPEPDNDRDGILDQVDQCPNEAETINGYADDDGCPDDQDLRVVGDKILLDDRVHFETNRSVVLGVSQPLLWRVAQMIIKHPEYTSLEVQGYADQRGDQDYNQKLSEARALAVKNMLIRYGVSRERLTSVGFGTDNPRVPERSGRAYKENRRVEFRITREQKDVLRSNSAPDAVEPAPAPVPAPAPATDGVSQ